MFESLFWIYIINSVLLIDPEIDLCISHALGPDSRGHDYYGSSGFTSTLTYY